MKIASIFRLTSESLELQYCQMRRSIFAISILPLPTKSPSMTPLFPFPHASPPPKIHHGIPSHITSSLSRPQQKAQPPPQHNHHTDNDPRQFKNGNFIPLLRHPTQAACRAFNGGRHGGKDFGLAAWRSLSGWLTIESVDGDV